VTLTLKKKKKNQGSLKPTDPVFMTSKYPRGATSQFVPLEKFSLSLSSSSFVIWVNLPYPEPSLFPYGLVLSIWWFSFLVNYYFQVSLIQFKGNFIRGQNNSKYRD